jgi:adenine-specific DNA methylase
MPISQLIDLTERTSLLKSVPPNKTYVETNRKAMSVDPKSIRLHQPPGAAYDVPYIDPPYNVKSYVDPFYAQYTI